MDAGQVHVNCAQRMVWQNVEESAATVYRTNVGYVSSLYLFSVTAANGNSPQPVFNDCLSAFLFCYCPSPPPIFDYFQQQRVRVRTHVQGTGWLVWEIPGHDQSESSFQKDIAPPSVKMLKLRVKHPLKLLNQS